MQKNRLTFLLVTMISVALVTGCTSIQRSSKRQKPLKHEKPMGSTFDQSSGDEDGGADGPDDLQEAPVRPQQISVPKVGVILGPGMALSMAHAGVLKAFDEKKIPVDHVIGLGWGSVIGALYAKQGMANDAQWRIYKLKKEDLPGKSFFSSSVSADSVKSMKGFLTDGLQKTAISKSKISFSCPAMALKNGRTYWQRRGTLVDAVSKCIAFPPLFLPESGAVVGDLFALSQAVKYLRQRDIGLIIYVDVLHKGELLSSQNLKENYSSFILWNEIRRLSLRSHAMMGEVIQVNTGPFHLMDFEKKQILVQRGHAAGKAGVQKIVEKYGF